MLIFINYLGFKSTSIVLHITKQSLLLLAIGMLLYSCGGESVLTNPPPSTLTLTHSLISVNPYTVLFSANANDSDQLTYTWDFGEGTEIEGAGVQEFVFDQDQEFVITVSVSDGVNDPISTFVRINTSLVDLTVNQEITFQTIQGFGGFGASKPWWGTEPFYDDSFVSMLIEDLGVTIIRDNVPIGFEPENDNEDPYDLDLTKFNTTYDVPETDSYLGQHIPYLSAMHEAGLEKLIATVWSPPIWMKHNNHRGNGTTDEYSAPAYTDDPDSNTNQLKVDNYEEFAEYCVAYVKVIKQETGIDLYAISLQNEPRFSQFFASCIHSFESYRDLVKVVGARFEAENLSTKIFMPEDVGSMFHIEGYIQAILDDPDARKYVDIVAIHNYENDGVTASNVGPTNWASTAALAAQNGSEVWMTETSGFEDDWDGAFSLGLSIYNALNFGNINAWVYWQLSGGNDQALILSGSPNSRYFVSKNYYRYIRPGAVRLEIFSESTDVLALAFMHDTEETKTVVILNNEDKVVGTRLNGAFKDTNFTAYLTSEVDDHVDMGAMSGSEGLLLPAKSIITLYSN